MKVRNTLSSALMLCAMAATLALLAAAMGDHADAQQTAVKVYQPQAGYGLTTGLVGIAETQTARLTVWNKGGEAVLARLQFVDDKGQVLILSDAVVQPGKAATLDWPCCGAIPGPHRVELQAQYGSNEKTSILLGLLVPTLQVIDNASGADSWMIGQEGFTEIRPIFVPSLVPPY